MPKRQTVPEATVRPAHRARQRRHRLYQILPAAGVFAAAAAAPGLALIRLGGPIANPEFFWTAVVGLPAFCAGVCGALLAPRFAAAGGGLRGFGRSLALGAAVVLLSLLCWGLLASLLSLWSGRFSVLLIPVTALAAATVGGVVLYPLGGVCGALLWLCRPARSPP